MALLSTEENELVDHLMSKLMKKLHATTETWESVAIRLMRRRMDCFDFESKFIPLNSSQQFCTLYIRTKVFILAGVCSWRMEGRDVKDVLERSSALRRCEPIGIDSHNRVYWYFGKHSMDDRIYVEELPAVSGDGIRLAMDTVNWALAATGLSQMQALSEKFKDSSEELDIQLRNKLDNEIISVVEKVEKARKKTKRVVSSYGALSLKNLLDPTAVRATRYKAPARYRANGGVFSHFKPPVVESRAMRYSRRQAEVKIAAEKGYNIARIIGRKPRIVKKGAIIREHGFGPMIVHIPKPGADSDSSLSDGSESEFSVPTSESSSSSGYSIESSSD